MARPASPRGGPHGGPWPMNSVRPTGEAWLTHENASSGRSGSAQPRPVTAPSQAQHNSLEEEIGTSTHREMTTWARAGGQQSASPGERL